MPLSEQEQRLLEEMERNLYQNDADFVARVSGTGRPSYTSIVVGILVALAGIASLIIGVSTHLVIVGILGFIIMFAGVLLSLRGPRRAVAKQAPQSPRPARKASFIDRMNDRWERRDEGQ